MTSSTQPLPEKVLLHSCCAPCSCAIIDQLLSEGIRPAIFFYNPNIDTVEEYLRRKVAVTSYAHKHSLEVVDVDYDPDVWKARVKGLEQEPERGKRCTVCFDVRLERTALYCMENGYRAFATTNGIGRWKDLEQVNASGRRAAARYPGLVFLDRNWRVNNALGKAAEITRQEGFYRQKYCGCIYSKKSLD